MCGRFFTVSPRNPWFGQELYQSCIRTLLLLVRWFNLDSLRGIFGFLPEESPTLGDMFDCDVMMIQFWTQGLKISVSKRYFSGDYTPIVKAASAQGWARGINVNLGNLGGEKAFNKSPILIAFALFICSGLTTWLLEVVQAEWTWVKIVAIPGLCSHL